jgi:DNA repair exonuclease SbcCD ATPase subunit
VQVDFLEERIADFKAFSGKHSFALDLPGVTFVRGENLVAERLGANGAAKSSLWDALCWCLYGRTPEDLRNPDIIPWSKSGNPRVTLELRVDNEVRKVCRTVDPNKLILDGKEVGQDEIETLIGMGFDLFTNTVLLAQGQPLFFDLQPKDKMDLFSKTLQLDRWDARSKAADTAACEAEADLSDLESEKRGFDSALEEVATVLATTKTQADSWVAKNRKLTRDVTDRRKKLQAEYDKKDKQLAGALLKLESAGTELTSLDREYRKQQDELSKLNTVLRTAEVRVSEAEEKVEEIRQALRELSTTRTCPTCGQSVKPSSLGKHRAHLEEKLQQFEANIKAGVPKKVKHNIELLEKRIEGTLSYARSFQAKQASAEHERNRLQPEVATLKAQLQELGRLAKEGEEQVNPFLVQIAQLQKRQKELKQDKLKCDEEIAEASRRAERNKFWVKGFKDIKLQLIEDVLEELELVTNSMIEEVGLEGWEVNYDIERETKSGTVQRALHVQIRSPQSKGFVKWKSWSGGEKQRLRLVGALALSDVLLAHAGVETNLEILDEPALYWSTEGVQELCGFLAERARQSKRSIFYIEHQAVESTHFANILTVVRDSQGAFIEGDGA